MASITKVYSKSLLVNSLLLLGLTTTPLEASILAKYILFGSTGSDLLNGDIDTAFECLEESIVLIQRQSISIIWTAEAKKKFGNYLLALCPLLIEYNFSTEEEADVDLFQLRKCHHFKRMMLEAVPAKGAIAIPIPSSYELVSEVESWPVIQSFAISVNNDADGNLSPFSTGFFSSFFQIIDCTASVHTLYASLDGYVLENALNSVWGTAATQYKEIGSLLDDFLQGDGSTSDIEDISATLDLLFELGELQSAFPVESDLQPILLLGCETAALGDSDALVDVMSLRKEHAHEGNNDLKAVEHCIIEASEPSCGVRWCRSYFFSSTAMKRERELYQKLCLGLRRTMLNLLNAVTSSACKDNRDISEYISSGLFLLASQLNLGGNEELKVFSELRDAYGRRVVEEKSSEETLSSCWIYARLSVRDDSQQKNEESNACAIAVGDTFLLPPLTSSPPPSTLQTKALIADRVCLTSVFPYSFCLVRRTKHEPSENVSLAALLSSSSYESYHPSVVLLVDDPLSPLHFTNLRSFSEGFLIEKVDAINLSKSNQVVLSFEKHVAYAVLVDSEDLLSFASYVLKIPLTSSIAAPLVSGGFFLFLSLKSDVQPLSSSSSELASLNSFGLQISSDSSSLADAWRRHWNKALIEFNIPVFRKADWDKCAMSEGMGAACVALLQSQFYQLEVSGAGKGMSKAYLPEMTKAVSSSLPHVVSNTAEVMFLLDSCQLLRFNFDGSLPMNKFEERDSLLRLVVVLGSAGSGARTIVDQLHSRLASILSEEGLDEAEGLVNL